MRIIPICVLCFGLAVAGCSDWPDVPEPEGRVTSGVWPTLLPLSDLGRAPTGASDDLADFQTIELRADRLRRRAAVLRLPVTDQASFDRLRARLSQ